MVKPLTPNTLYYGDNLPILQQHFPDESVDLIYLDPPFNSNRSYNLLFKDESGNTPDAQITAFDDTWHWNAATEETYETLATQAPDRIAKIVTALRQFIGANQMMAYLVMMTARLAELHRVLSPTGSLYLHCDPTASHYLKLVLDAIFSPENYRNEIIWKRTTAHNDASRWGRVHDSILFYTKASSFVWNVVTQPYDEKYLERYNRTDEKGDHWTDDNLTAPGVTGGFSSMPWKGFDPRQLGVHWKVSDSTIVSIVGSERAKSLNTIEKLDILDANGFIYWPKQGKGFPRFKRKLGDGLPIQDTVTDIPPINSQAQERLGYPTQKPLALLERIINASSNPGDIVLDPFCGCGTAVAAAEKLGRRWVGIDITHLSISLIKYRMREMFPNCQFTIQGEPEDIGSAHQLAQDDRYQFQWWALSLVKARPLGGDASSKQGKKGSDKGIDGLISVIDDNSHKPKTVIIQVKSGHVKSGDIRDLSGTLKRENAIIGVFITLEPPTQEMIKEAATAGFYESVIWNQKYPCIQILTIEQLLAGATIKMPPAYGTFKQAGQASKSGPQQPTLDLGL